MSNRSTKALLFVLVAFVILESSYSFIQQLYSPLDGDMANIVVPSPEYSIVLKDPFGFQALLEGKKYSGPNRFFAHWFESKYFKTIPQLFHPFLNPVDSVYLAQGLLKFGMQLLIAWMLTLFVLAPLEKRRLHVWLCLALLMPLFHVHGYESSIGIVLNAITYAIFYSLPMGWLLLFFFPFYKREVSGSNFSFDWWQHVLLILLALVIPFSGPLTPAVAILGCGLTLLAYWLKNFRKSTREKISEKAWNAFQNIPVTLRIYFIGISLWSIYSYYIGLFNAESSDDIALVERYRLMWQGLNQQLWQSPAFPMLFALIAVNILILIRVKQDRRMVTFYLYLLLFSVAYVLLLPLGGHRAYRPLIIRSDTFLPVTICIVFVYASSTMLVLTRTAFRFKPIYATVLAVMLGVFTIADKFDHTHHLCEKKALKEISESNEPIVHLHTWCNVLEWHPTTDPGRSENIGQLLLIWGITDEKKLHTTQ